MSDIVIQVDSLSKQYRLGQIGGTTLREDLQRWWARVRHQPDPTLKVTETNVRDRRAGDDVTAKHAKDANESLQSGKPSPLASVRVFGGHPAPPVSEAHVRDRAAGDEVTAKHAKHANESLQDAAPSPLASVRVFSGHPEPPVSDYVSALKDISFAVKRGEVLGIIGRNGAGKSTLLKILSRITAPTTGQVKVKGRIASLLEVGTGMHGELTGRENIFLNGAILGMTKAEVAAKLDEIIAFSGCERYIDTPVKRYSSGMMVRLGFAVAAHLEPEILIVDEVLAVGDAEFQKKCIGKMQDVAGHGRTVLFVSHNMASIAQLTSRCMVLESGTTDFVGDTDQAVEHYLQGGPQPTQARRLGRRPVSDFPQEDVVILDPKVTFLEVGLSATTPPEIPVGGDIEADVLLQTAQAMEGLVFGFTVRDEVKGPVLTGYSPPFDILAAGSHRRHLLIRDLDLAPGRYDLCMAVLTGRLCEPKYTYAIVWGLGQFDVASRLSDGSLLGDWHRGWGRVVHHDCVVSSPVLP